MNTVMQDRITLTLTEAPPLIAATPFNKYHLIGEPGVGKTSMAKELSRITGYPFEIIDVPNMALGDGAIPVPNYEKKILEYFPNGKFRLHLGEPTIIFLDEFTKADEEVQNTLHPLLEVWNPRLGDLGLPKGSIVVLTGNLESDGVGDNLKAHTKMRITRVEISKPDFEEWLLWAAVNNISPIVMAWVNRTPDCLASYRDKGQETNPFIFNPNKVMEGTCVTPRTLELASYIVEARHKFTVNALKVALTGTIGAAAANSLTQFITYHESMTPWSEIMANPKTAPLPPSSGACAVMVFSALDYIKTADQLQAFMTYISRDGVDEEFQVIFGVGFAGPQATAANKRIAFSADAFTEWADKNQDLL